MSSLLGKLDLFARKGDTAQKIEIEIYISDENGNFNQNPEDLAGYQFYLEIRKSNLKVKELSLGNGLSINGDTLIIERIPEVDLSAGDYTYALKMIMPNGDKETFLKGKYTVENELVETS